jgi:hypothetical protein
MALFLVLTWGVLPARAASSFDAASFIKAAQSEWARLDPQAQSERGTLWFEDGQSRAVTRADAISDRAAFFYVDESRSAFTFKETPSFKIVFGYRLQLNGNAPGPCLLMVEREASGPPTHIYAVGLPGTFYFERKSPSDAILSELREKIGDTAPGHTTQVNRRNAVIVHETRQDKTRPYPEKFDTLLKVVQLAREYGATTMRLQSALISTGGSFTFAPPLLIDPTRKISDVDAELRSVTKEDFTTDNTAQFSCVDGFRRPTRE